MSIIPTSYNAFDFESGLFLLGLATIGSFIYVLKANYSKFDKFLLSFFIIVISSFAFFYSFVHRDFSFPNHYRDQLTLLYNEGTALKTVPVRRDGGGGVNVDLYPELKKWRKDLPDRVPKIYKYIFETEDDSNKFFLKLSVKGFIPANNGEEGDLYQSTFASLEYLRDHQAY